MDQVDVWRGEFGKAYTDRNKTDWRVKLPIFRDILAGFGINSILEVGCNRGCNMVALRHLLGDSTEIVGVEPNEYAAGLAREEGFVVQDGTVYGLPFASNRFDLVFTNGVLIHVPLDKLEQAIREMHRVSKRHILAIEYYAEEETIIPYRGYDNLLWKRNFLHEFKSVYPDLLLVDHRLWGTGDNPTCDRMDSWLFEKKDVHH